MASLSGIGKSNISSRFDLCSFVNKYHKIKEDLNDKSVRKLFFEMCLLIKSVPFFSQKACASRIAEIEPYIHPQSVNKVAKRIFPPPAFLPRNRRVWDINFDTWSAGGPYENRMEASKRIYTAQETQANSIDLKELALTAVPECLAKLPHLNTFDLRNNCIKKLPLSFSFLSSEQIVEIDGYQSSNILKEIFLQPEWVDLRKNSWVLAFDHGDHGEILFTYWNIRSLLKHLFGGNFPEELNTSGLQKVLIQSNISQLEAIENFLTIFYFLETTSPQTKNENQTRLLHYLNQFTISEPFLFFTLMTITNKAKNINVDSAASLLNTIDSILNRYLNEPFHRALYDWELKAKQGESREIAVSRISMCYLHKCTSLDLAHLNLKTLPKEISHLHRLTLLNVSYNQLETIPEELHTLPNIKIINIKHNPSALYQSTVYLDLHYFWMLTKTLTLHLPSPDLTNTGAFKEFRSLIYTLFPFPLPSRLNAFNLAKHLRIKTEEEIFLLNQFFRKLKDMHEYVNSASRPQTLKRIEQIIQGIASHSTFLDAALVDLSGRTETCVDEMALTFSQIEILRLLYCQSPHVNLEELAKLLIGLKRLELLETWVLMRCILKSNRGAKGEMLLDLKKDPIYRKQLEQTSEVLEVALALRLSLKESLGLPSETQSMQFTNCAEREIGSLDEAANACAEEVLSFTSEIHDLLPVVMENETWRKHIERETDPMWIEMQDALPLSAFHEFLLNMIDSSMTDADKVASLSKIDFPFQSHSLYVIQERILEEMAQMHYQLHLTTSCRILYQLGFVNKNEETLNQTLLKLNAQASLERQKRKQKLVQRESQESKED